jgi:uncharacterized OB-fold protein
MISRPIAPDLFEITDSGPRLLGGRRKTDGTIVFPLPSGGERARYERVQLRPDGVLWSWTVQRFRPKTPPYAGPETETEFQPYVVGYVELPGEVIVEARIVDVEPDDIAIGMKLALTIIPFRCGEDGTEVTTYAFWPAAGNAS